MFKINKWQERHFQRAKTVASWSKDDSTKVGCVSVVEGKYQIMDGYNGLPDYLNDDDITYWQRPQKYEYVDHAEANMVDKLHKFNINLHSYDLYMLWFPCPNCMSRLIASNCKNIFCNLKDHKLNKSEEYKDKFKISFTKAVKAGVKVYYTVDEKTLEVMDYNRLNILLND